MTSKYDAPIIPKAELEHGCYYEGTCRNASVARWNALSEKFIYWRYKFGQTFAEDIRHPEDDDGFDLFRPWKKITDTAVEEIPLEA